MVTIALDSIKSVEELIALLKRESEVVLKEGNEEITLTIQTTVTQEAQQASGERIFGLTKGAFIVSDDFDDPLPDEFWLGEDEPTT